MTAPTPSTQAYAIWRDSGLYARIKMATGAISTGWGRPRRADRCGRTGGAAIPDRGRALSARQQRRCARTYAAATLPALARPAAPPPAPACVSAIFPRTSKSTRPPTCSRKSWNSTTGARSRSPHFRLDLLTRRRCADDCAPPVSISSTSPISRRAAIAALAAQRGLDIAVDLKGFTTDARPKIFAAGAAPIQVNYLGYPMTSGADCFDYIIADRVLIGQGEVSGYSEKVAWLPDSYQPNDRKRAIAAASTTRVDHGLPPDAFVFASFNAAYKLVPRVFAIWMDLLRSVPGSVLWLILDRSADNLRRAAGSAGVDPARLVFAPPRDAPEHLERIAHADRAIRRSQAPADRGARQSRQGRRSLLAATSNMPTSASRNCWRLSEGLIATDRRFRRRDLGRAPDPRRGRDREAISQPSRRHRAAARSRSSS